MASAQAPGYPAKGGVALVLSGGGAKGLYHVGIIKALEENDIPIDYISGASMGAIVGSLYASGWSADRMWSFFVTDSVSTWLSGRIPKEYDGFFRRFERTPEMVGINIMRDTVKNRSVLEIPTNFISPYMLDIAFSQLLAPASVAAGDDFDNLMVPFRCVATDTYKKELVSFSQGYLPFAVRASMTIPLVFKPLQQDSTLFFDGGIMNNFPFQVVEQDFSPSNIIGGVCTDNFDNPGPDNLSGQVMALAMRRTQYDLPDSLRDINIKRVMPEIGVLDYHLADTIMRLGYNDAMAMMPIIKERVKVRRSKSEVEQRRRAFLAKIPALTFDSVLISGITPAQERYVRRQLEVYKVKYFNYDYFYENYMRIISAGVFTSDFPVLSFDKQSGYYRIHLQMSTKAAMRFSLGGNISSTSLNQGYAAFRYRTTSSFNSAYSLEGYFGMFYNAAKLNGRHEFYSKSSPFYLNYNFYAEWLNYDNNNMGAYYRNKDFRVDLQHNLGVNLSYSTPILDNSAFRTHLNIAQSSYTYFESLHTSADTASVTKFNYISVAPEIETSSINYPLYPTRGTRQLLSARYTLGLESYDGGSLAARPDSGDQNRWWFKFRYLREKYFELARWFTLGYLVDVVYSNHPTFETYLATELTSPRFAPIPEMQSMFMTEYASASYVGFGVTPIFEVLRNKKLYVKCYFYTFIPQELIFESGEWYGPTTDRFEQWVDYVYGGTVVYQTPIGPASFGVGRYTTGRNNWSFQFNFGYTLFNNIVL